jgi:hypothetical protein
MTVIVDSMISIVRPLVRMRVPSLSLGVALALVLTACGGSDSAHEWDSSMEMEEMNMDTSANNAGHGLSDTENGYKLVLDETTFQPQQPATLKFHINNAEGKVQTDFAINQTKLIHVYVIRTDTTNYQHLHPELKDGTFSVPVTFKDPGSYRVFADFKAIDSSGKHELTLSSTVNVPGTYSPTPVPAPSQSATVDGYTINFAGDMMAGMSHDLTATITKNGQSVTDLEPYLDTYAHLTGFKTDTLAVTHVHPHNATTDGKGGPTLQFMAEFPTMGNYRLFVQFQTSGVLHTAEVTYHVS